MVERVVLLPTYEQALSYRKDLARKAPTAAFGINVLTPQMWLTDAWQRWGDGRRLIEPLQRSLAVLRLTQSIATTNNHELSDGVRTLIGSFFADAIGTQELEQALISPPNTLSDQEQFVLSLVAPYRAYIAQHGFIEPGDAYQVLAQNGCQVEFEQTVFFDMPRAFEQFCTEYAAIKRPSAHCPVHISPLSDGVEPAFLFAAGPSAQNALIVQDVLDRFRNTNGCTSEALTKRILVVSARARDLYRDFARAINTPAPNSLASQNQTGDAQPPNTQPPNPSASFAQESHVSGITCCLRTSVPFFQTDFGRSYQALVDFLLDPHHETKAFLDYVHSAYAGIAPDRVCQIDAAVRGNRLLTFEDLCALARLTSQHFDAFEELLSDADASVLFGYFEEETANLTGCDAAYRAEQKAAIAQARSVYEAARVWGAEPQDLQSVLAACSVRVSCVTSDHDPQIYIIDTNQNNADRLGDEVFDEVYICDLDARYYPARGKHSALVTLEKKIGCAKEDNTLEQRRQWFESLKARAQKRLVCQRVLHAGGEEDVYPAFILEEFIESYRSLHGASKNNTESDELDEFGLPACLQNALVTRGEELFAANVALTRPEDIASIALPPLPEHRLKPEAQEVLFPSYARATSFNQATGHVWPVPTQSTFDQAVPNQPTFDQAVSNQPAFNQAPSNQPAFSQSVFEQASNDAELVLSPSAIEAYINCPYYWFVTQRIRPTALDEELGSLEKGTFVHAVWELFYERLFAETGARRVTPGILAQAHHLLEQIFNECLAAQPEEAGSRYVPRSPTELAEAQRLKTLLGENLGLQARLMPTFAPTDAELSLTVQHNIHYAGVIVRGRIDRLDVDEDLGHYVVVDYKGSIAGHDAGCSDEDEVVLPHKIQALIYAQALRGRVGSYRPVGALYVNYQARDARDLVAGSYDASMLDVSRCAKRASAVCFNFETYLDRIESLVEQRLSCLKQGVIDPDPLCTDSCRYCPVAGCERRLS